MGIDDNILSYAIRAGDLGELQRAGVSEADFVDEYKLVWRFLVSTYREHDSVPSASVVRSRFPDLHISKVKPGDLSVLLKSLRQRRKFIEFMHGLNDAATAANSYETVDDVIQSLQSKLNELSTRDSKSHLVDVFNSANSKVMLQELQNRRSGKVTGISSGLNRFDRIAGGLQRQKMVVIIGRPGQGKSWLDLLLVANAVTQGSKVMLYPLEMSLAETCFRLYTLFSQKLFGVERVLRNYDLTTGKVNGKKLARFTSALEDKFKGQLFVADMATLGDPYTNERIEAEVELHKPDMFWVDYLTLLKPPPSLGRSNADEWGAVRALSNGIKTTAMRRNVVGGCSAQVNREAMRSRVFLPRLEHIAYGDSIGQDADQVLSINRRAEALFYALVKNRGGPEFGRTRVKFHVDVGLIEEVEGDEDDDDESEET